MGSEIVSEEIVEQQGSFQRYRRWLKGWHPSEGVLTHGWRRERQTRQEGSRVLARHTFMVNARAERTTRERLLEQVEGRIGEATPEQIRKQIHPRDFEEAEANYPPGEEDVVVKEEGCKPCRFPRNPR